MSENCVLQFKAEIFWLLVQLYFFSMILLVSFN